MPVEIAHIVAWSEVREHRAENLIALCPTCHSRFDRGDIDQKSMRTYKANLGLLNSRYSDLERRFLEMLASQPGTNAMVINGDMSFQFAGLFRDGMIVGQPTGAQMVSVTEHGEFFAGPMIYALTPAGQTLVAQFVDAVEIA